MANVEIKTHGINAKNMIDGVEVPNASRYLIEHNAGGLRIVHIDVPIANLTFDSGDFVPSLPDWLKPFYELKTTK